MASVEINPYAQRFTGLAAVDLSAKQFFFVKVGADSDQGPAVTTIAAITDKPIGVVQDTPAAGDLTAVVAGGICKAKVGAGAGVTIGDILGVDNTGAVKTIAPGTDTTQYIVGRALSTAGASDLVTILVALAGRAS